MGRSQPGWFPATHTPKLSVMVTGASRAESIVVTANYRNDSSESRFAMRYSAAGRWLSVLKSTFRVSLAVLDFMLATFVIRSVVVTTPFAIANLLRSQAARA